MTLKIIPDAAPAPLSLGELLRAKLAASPAEQPPADSVAEVQEPDSPEELLGARIPAEYAPLTETQGRTIYAKFLSRLTYAKDGAEPYCKKYLGPTLFAWVSDQARSMSDGSPGFSWQKSACELLGALMENSKYLEERFAAERPKAEAAVTRIGDASKNEEYLKHLTPAGVKAHCRAQTAASIGIAAIATNALRAQAVKSAVLAGWCVAKSGACEFTLLTSLSAAWDAYLLFVIDVHQHFLKSSVPSLAGHLAALERNEQSIKAAEERAESGRLAAAAQAQAKQPTPRTTAEASLTDSHGEDARSTWTAPAAEQSSVVAPVFDAFDEPTLDQSWLDIHDSISTNPANGLLMVGGIGGLDVHGNTFGTSFNDPF